MSVTSKYGVMDYKRYLDEEELAGYLRGKDVERRLGKVAKQVVAELVGGRIEKEGKNFLSVPGDDYRYRLASRNNSDNTTETREHLALGVKTIVLDDEGSMKRFFRDHGLAPGPTVKEFHYRVEEEMEPPSSLF